MRDDRFRDLMVLLVIFVWLMVLTLKVAGTC